MAHAETAANRRVLRVEGAALVSGHGRLSGHSVLVLEDQFLLADDLRREFEDAGAEVMGPFSDTAAAITHLDGRTPSCAVVDLNLGLGVDFSTARALVARGVPVIFVTGYDADTLPTDLAGSAHLLKPTQSEDVLDAVVTACSPHHV
jgi:ActR/RegA family two-component response regulator